MKIILFNKGLKKKKRAREKKKSLSKGQKHALKSSILLSIKIHWMGDDNRK